MNGEVYIIYLFIREAWAFLQYICQITILAMTIVGLTIFNRQTVMTDLKNGKINLVCPAIPRNVERWGIEPKGHMNVPEPHWSSVTEL